MATLSRELKITYGGYTVGGTSNALLTRFWTSKTDKDFTEIGYEFIVTATTERAFTTRCQVAETAFRTPYQKLVITQGTNVLLAADQNANTGLDAEPRIVKLGQVGDSGRSRLYQVTISFENPATTVGHSTTGMRELNVAVQYTPARRATMTLTGVFTAAGSNDALAQYNAKIAAVRTAQLAAHSITNWELANEELDVSINGKTIQFEQIIDEIIFSQGGASLDDTDIVRQLLRVQKVTEDGRSSVAVDELATINLNWDVWVDKSSTTDLEDVYSDARTWLLARGTDVLGGTTFGILNESIDYDRDQNRITAFVQIRGPTGAENLLALQLNVQDVHDDGTVHVPAWTGNPFSKHQFQGPATLKRTVTEVCTCSGVVSAAQASELSARMKTALSSAINTHGQSKPSAQGRRTFDGTSQERVIGYGTDSFTVTDITLRATVNYFEPVEAGLSGETPGGTLDNAASPNP